MNVVVCKWRPIGRLVRCTHRPSARGQKECVPWFFLKRLNHSSFLVPLEASCFSWRETGRKRETFQYQTRKYSGSPPCRLSGVFSAQTPIMPGEIIRDDRAIRIADAAKTVAVLGIKTESQASQPAYFVPEFLQSTGIEIVPVPVFYPEVKEILGVTVVRDLKEINRPIDILDVFRRPSDLHSHVEDILAMHPRPKCVWLQSGISNPEFEQAIANAGITVVVSRCLKVDRSAAGYRAKF